IFGPRDRFSTIREVANAWYRAVERPIAMSSIYRRIRSFGIRSYRPHLVVTRLRGERRNFAFSIERPIARIVGVMVWGAICFGSRSRLVFIQGNLTAIRYVQEVLRPVVVPYFRRVNNALFQQDNARPHIANVPM
ncbi:unnamed protein product, partial [Tenebrio molitor]